MHIQQRVLHPDNGGVMQNVDAVSVGRQAIAQRDGPSREAREDREPCEIGRRAKKYERQAVQTRPRERRQCGPPGQFPDETNEQRYGQQRPSSPMERRANIEDTAQSVAADHDAGQEVDTIQAYPAGLDREWSDS